MSKNKPITDPINTVETTDEKSPTSIDFAPSSDALSDNERNEIEKEDESKSKKIIRFSFGKGAFGKQIRKKDKIKNRIKASRAKRKEAEKLLAKKLNKLSKK